MRNRHAWEDSQNVRTLKVYDLEQQARAHGYRHRYSPGVDKNVPLLSGQFNLTTTYSDLLIHLSDHIESHDGRVSCERSAELTVGVLLEGKLRFSLGNQTMNLAVPAGGTPQCFLFNTLYPETWSRDLQRNARVVKSLVCLPHSWLKKRFVGMSDTDLYVQRLMLLHGVMYHRPARNDLTQLAQSLIQAGKSSSSIVELEGLALTMVVSCLKLLEMQNPLHNLQYPRAISPSQQSLRICQFIEDQIIAAKSPIQITLAEVACHLGTSVSTAQRQFKADFKLTIMEYIRTRRLEMARRLLKNNMSIGEVAYLCGYSHSSNFSIAFKKHFGAPPGDINIADASAELSKPCS